MKTPVRAQRNTFKSVLRLSFLGLALGTLPSCSVGYIDRARFLEPTPNARRDDLKITLEEDARGVFWLRDGGKANLYISAKAEDEPKVSAVFWRTGEEWQEVKNVRVSESWEQSGPSWYLVVPLGFLFKATEPTDVELRVHLLHRGRQEIVVQRYRVVRDQEWHTFNLALDVT
jgi:hypothetical protein